MGSLIISAVFLVAGILMWFALKPLRRGQSNSTDEVVVTNEQIFTLLQNIESRVKHLEDSTKVKKAKSDSGKA